MFSNCPAAACLAYFSACLIKSCVYRQDESLVNLVPNQLLVTMLTKGALALTYIYYLGLFSYIIFVFKSAFPFLCIILCCL